MSTGARRRLPLLLQHEEDVALVGVHYQGQFLPFPNVDWDVSWGTWNIEGSYEEYSVTLTGNCTDNGFPVLCPTLNGMEPIAQETFKGDLRVQLYQNGRLLVDDTTKGDACLEIGGLPWKEERWQGKSTMTEPIRSIVLNKKLDHFAADFLARVDRFVKIPGLSSGALAVSTDIC
jgi:tocopherol cyclase